MKTFTYLTMVFCMLAGLSLLAVPQKSTENITLASAQSEYDTWADIIKSQKPKLLANARTEAAAWRFLV